MKKNGLKKYLISLGIGVLLTFGITVSAAAATGSALQKKEAPVASEPIIIEQADDIQAASYLSYTTNIIQTNATTTKITIQWAPVANATGYRVYLGGFRATSDYEELGVTPYTACQISNLKPGTAYTVRIVAENQTETSEYYSSVECTTLYKSVSVKATASTSSSYSFQMKAPNPVNSISGYRVTYTSYSTKKAITRDYDVSNSHIFTINGLKNNAFYKVLIRPYIKLNNKKFVSSYGTTKYIALQPDLSKTGYTSSSMSVKWNKIAGATSYSVYVRYPGQSSYKRVKTTTATSYKLTGMKKNTTYYIKVIANKKVGSKTWKSQDKYYYTMRLYTYYR